MELLRGQRDPQHRDPALLRGHARAGRFLLRFRADDRRPTAVRPAPLQQRLDLRGPPGDLFQLLHCERFGYVRRRQLRSGRIQRNRLGRPAASVPGERPCDQPVRPPQRCRVRARRGRGRLEREPSQPERHRNPRRVERDRGSVRERAIRVRFRDGHGGNERRRRGVLFRDHGLPRPGPLVPLRPLEHDERVVRPPRHVRRDPDPDHSEPGLRVPVRYQREFPRGHAGRRQLLVHSDERHRRYS